jgi:hypothetical protein
MEKRIIAEAYNDNFQVTLKSCYRNFQSWYEIETFNAKTNTGFTTERHDVDKAFDLYEDKVKRLKLQELTK